MTEFYYDEFNKHVLSNWKAHSYRMERLLKKIENDLLLDLEYMARFFPDEEAILKKSSKYRREILKLINKPFIGK